MKSIFVAIVLIFACAMFAQDQNQQQVQYEPKNGPYQYNIRDNIATVNLLQGYILLNKPDLRKMYQQEKEPINGDEECMIFQEGGNWAVTISYSDIGYVKDDDADNFNSDDLLSSLKNGAIEDNKKRSELGNSNTLEVLGWEKIPEYNRETNVLSWTLVLLDNDKKIVNYTTIKFGRYGTITTILVADYGVNKQGQINLITDMVAFNQGNRYGEWISSDKVSDVTMTGLITGGAAAAAYGAAKVGIMSKLGNFFIAALLILKKGIILLLIPIGVFFKWVFKKIKGE